MPTTHSGTEGLADDASPLSPARIVATDGPSRGATARLEHGTLLVGSGDGADLVLADKAVSRTHASLELLPGAVRVKDLGSRNGTRYLGARIDTAIVPLGGSIELGRTTLQLLADDAPTDVADVAQPPGIIGTAPSMRRLFTVLEKLAASDAPVLFEGESGVGKEAFARAMHQRSSRASHPFVVVDCGAINPNLIESELYGVAKGAFTGADRARAGFFEQAAGGTLLFDEPSALPLELQPRLLRVLESKEFRRVGDTLTRKASFRAVATSQVDLEAAANAGTFRKDLFFRLAVTRVRVPALRERRDDIPLLAAHFSRESLPRSTLAAMQCHAWPGNVRELKAAVERAQAKLDALERPAQGDGKQQLTFLEAREHLIDDFERSFLRDLMEQHRGNVSAAAREAGLARSFLYTLLRRHGLARD